MRSSGFGRCFAGCGRFAACSRTCWRIASPGSRTSSWAWTSAGSTCAWPRPFDFAPAVWRDGTRGLCNWCRPKFGRPVRAGHASWNRPTTCCCPSCPSRRHGMHAMHPACGSSTSGIPWWTDGPGATARAWRRTRRRCCCCPAVGRARSNVMSRSRWRPCGGWPSPAPCARAWWFPPNVWRRWRRACAGTWSNPRWAAWARPCGAPRWPSPRRAR